MKRTLLFLFICGIFVITMQGQYVTIEGRQFKDENGADFYPVVCNYIVNYFFTTDTVNFFITPQSDGWGYECDGSSTCDTQFYHNFLQLKHMKFNTIRLFGTTPVYVDTLNGGKPGFRIDAFHNTNFYNPPINEHQFFLQTPYESDSTTHQIFALIDRILVQADHAGLKVILLSGGAKGRFYPELDTAYYPEFLSALSHHIANHSPTAAKNALLAYDLFNEPGSSDQMGWPWSAGHYKKDVCNRVANWYDAVKTNDSSHLITMGAGGVDDILEYDLSVMKLDFASPHFYPKKTIYEPVSVRYNAMLNRVKGILYWIGKNSQMPYIIGETGFSAQANILPDLGLHGDTSEQRQFAEASLQFTRDCQGSGYSWWKYQNSYWGFSIYEDSFGLLDGGICLTPCVSLEKPVVKAFTNFDATGPLNTCDPPANYFDPWNHETFSPDSNKFRGNVKDLQQNLPVQDAVVFARTLLKINPYPQDSTYDYTYTFTDSIGNFTIRPYDSITPYTSNKIRELYISAPGSERIFRQAGNPWAPLINNSDYLLSRRKWNYNGETKNCTISNTCIVALQGWNSLKLTDVIVQSGSNVTINARVEINIDHYFESESGSELSINCLPTFPICTDYDGFLKKSSDELFQSTTFSPKENVIELEFLLSPKGFTFSVFPNPVEVPCQVNVIITGQVKAYYHVEIVNCLGVVVFHKMTEDASFSIDISSFSKGLYFILISTDIDSQTQKVLIQ